MNAMEILVIILSSALALFLIISIVLVALLIKVTMQIKKVTGTAERAATNIETMTRNVSKVTSPMLIVRMMTSQFKKYSKNKK